MGNVLATNAPSQFNSSLSQPFAPPPPINPILSPSLPPPNDLNPGTFEELHKNCKELYPMTFEGAKFIVNKILSTYFHINHTFSMSPPSGYKFGATYVGATQISPTERYPILLGDIDPDGNLNATIVHLFSPKIRTKFFTQIVNSNWMGTHCTTDYRGLDFTASITCVNLNLLQGSGLLVLQYLQTVSSSLSLGTELGYQFGPYMPQKETALVSLVAKMTGSNFTLSGTLNSQGSHLCYYLKGGPNLQFGAEVETNWMAAESICSLGYQVDLPKSNFTFRGMITSNWTVAAVLEKKLLPMPLTFALSASLNHLHNQFKLGCGFILG